jgi:hypothetical protein
VHKSNCKILEMRDKFEIRECYVPSEEASPMGSAGNTAIVDGWGQGIGRRRDISTDPQLMANATNRSHLTGRTESLSRGWRVNYKIFRNHMYCRKFYICGHIL